MKKYSAQDWFHLTAAVGIAPQLFRVAPVIALLSLAFIAWFAFAMRGKALAMPRRFRTAFTLATIIVILACYRSIFGFEPGIAFLLLTTALKLHELESRRDYFILLTLASLLMIAEVVHSQNLGTTVYSFAGLFLVLYSLMILSAASDLRAPAPLVWRGARRIAVAGLPIMAVLFVVFPRVQLNLLGALTANSAAKIGFNDELRPGEVAKLAKSEEPAFRVTFPEGRPPVMRELYWRGAILTATDGVAWYRQRRIFLETPRVPPPGAVAQDIVLEAHGNKWLFALDEPALVVPAQERSLQPLRLAGGIFENTNGLRARVAYRAYSSVGKKDFAELGEEEKARNLKLPRALDPRIQALGRELASGGADPRAIVDRALGHFKNGFEYTLNPGSTGTQGIGAFLFETKKGFCEHFASALAIMLRSAGVPARVVVGFHGGLMNPYGHYLTVRFQDAHAWVETWLPGSGWTRVDPTDVVAPQRIDGGGQAFLGRLAGNGLGNFQNLADGEERNLRYFISEAIFFADSVNSQWNVFLLSYDFDYQRELLSRILPAMPVWKMFGFAGGVGAALIGLILFFVYRRARAPRDRVVTAYQAMLKRLARRGVRKHRSEGPLDFACRASTVLPEEGENIRGAIDLFVELRYGYLDRDSAKVSEFQKRARKVA